jgi:hypothetical protein
MCGLRFGIEDGEAVKHAVLTGYSARNFRDLLGSGRLATAIRQAAC